MEKLNTFEELVKKQEEHDISVVEIFFALSLGGFACTGFDIALDASFFTILTGCCMLIIGVIGLIWKTKYEKPAEKQVYLKMPIENVMKSEINYCVTESSNDRTIFIRSDYLKSYYLEIANVQNVEDTLKILSELPKEILVKNILNRIGEDNSIADILHTTVRVVRPTNKNTDDERWNVLIKENRNTTDLYEEITRYLPEK